MKEHVKKNMDLIIEMAEKAHKNDYSYYFDDRKPVFKPTGLNCFDEIAPGSHDRSSKIKQLMNKRITIDEHTTKNIGKIIFELHDLMKEEHMAITDCTEQEANMFLDCFVDFNHVTKHVSFDGKEYLQVHPKIGNKYQEE